MFSGKVGVGRGPGLAGHCLSIVCNYLLANQG